MKKLLLTICILFASVFSNVGVSANKPPVDEGKKWAMVRIYLNAANDYESAITVTYSDGKSEKTALMQSKAKFYEVNDKQIVKAMNDLFNKGYKIFYSNNTTAGDLTVTTYFMEAN